MIKKKKEPRCEKCGKIEYYQKIFNRWNGWHTRQILIVGGLCSYCHGAAVRKG